MLVAKLAGNTATVAHATTLKLGNVVEVTSTFLGIAAVDYIVQRFKYDFSSNETTLTLHPKVSQVGMEPLDGSQPMRNLQDARRGSTDSFIPKPAGDVI